MSRTGRLGNIVFKKESTWGSYITGDILLRASSESLNNKVENVEDPSLIGEIYTTKLVKVAEGIEGSIEGVAHPDVIGVQLHSVLGGESSVVSNASLAFLGVSYNGANAYERITKSGTSITIEKSSNGSSWTGDSNFGTAGVLDVSASGYDTTSELAVYIAARTGFDSFLLGSTTGDSTNIPDFAATLLKSASAKIGAKLMTVDSTSASAKKHTLFPASASGELPSYCYTINRLLGTNESVAFTGVKTKTLTLQLPAKDMAKINMSLDGKQELTAQTDIALAVPESLAFTASNAKIIFEDATGNLTEFDEVKDLSVTINSNVDDNRVIGSVYKKEQIRQKADMTISMTANNTSGQYALRTNYLNATGVSLWLYMQSASSITTGIPYSVLIRIPEVQFTDFNSPLSTPDRLTITAAATVVKPSQSTYSEHIYCYVVDGITAVY
jgi:hypothetical protein